MNPSLKKSLASCICVLALISGMADAGEVADELRGVSSIQFYPKVPYAELEITVSGGGVYWQQQYAPGKSVSFSASVAGVSGLPDGVYTYQLNAAPELDMEA